MVRTCRPIWKRQARETSPYISGMDLRQSVAFRWRILPRLSRCCANQERCPDHARLTDVGARVPVSVVNTGRSALQSCKSCEFLVLPQVGRACLASAPRGFGDGAVIRPAGPSISSLSGSCVRGTFIYFVRTLIVRFPSLQRRSSKASLGAGFERSR